MEAGSNPLAAEFECSICYGPLLDPVIGTLKGCPRGRGAEGVGRAPAGFVIGPSDGPYWGRADMIVILLGQTQEVRGQRQEVVVSG